MDKKATLVKEGLDESEDESRIAHMLNVILTGHPELLYDAQKAALAAHFTVEETEEELPAEIANETPLIASRYNVYQVVPADLNGWERSFVEELDGDDTDTVLWWHRNLPNKPWSVQVLLKDGGRFFPDFVIGIEGRKWEQSALLADPKYYFEHADQLTGLDPLYSTALVRGFSDGLDEKTVSNWKPFWLFATRISSCTAVTLAITCTTRGSMRRVSRSTRSPRRTPYAASIDG